MKTTLVSALLCSSALLATSAYSQTAAAADPAAPAAQSLGAAPGPAANVPAANAPAAQPTGVSEVVVTAQRRVENIQKTSLAVTALSGAALREDGVHDLRDLQNFTPALTVSDAGLISFLNIRGVGVNLQAATNTPGVALYRDGLFSPGAIFLNEGVFDIASVEVLRGPQGTFVGQNSTAGAVIQKSVSPKLDTTEGDGELTIGNYSNYKFEGGVTIPLTDTLAMRIATDLEHRDSFFKNLGPAGDKPGRVEGEHGRIGLLWQPSKSFSALWKTEVNYGSDGGYADKPIPGTQYAPLAPTPTFTLDYDRPDVKLIQFSVRSGLELNYYTPNGIDFRSVSGVQYSYQNFITDEDASSSPNNFSHQKISDNVYTQEINIISPDRGPFKWVVGGSVVYQIAQANLNFYYDGFPFNGSVFPQQDLFIDDTNPKVSSGIFAQGTYKLLSNLTLEIGGRFSNDRQTQGGGLYLLPNPPLPGYLDGSKATYTDNKATGKVALDWQITRRNLLYVFVANGFKSGGVNLPSGTFRPEQIVDYEGGWKSTLFGNHLATQLDGFYMDYRDLQLDVFNPYTTNTNIANIAKSKIYGAEATAQARFGAFSADGGLSYVHSALGSLSLINTQALPGGSATGLGVQCPNGVASGTNGCFNYNPYVINVTGQANPYSPTWTVNGAVQYAFDLGDGRRLTPRIDVSHLSSQTTGLLPDPVLNSLPSRTLWGGQLTYHFDRYQIALYALNIFNDIYRVGNNGNNTFYGAPRQFGVRFAGSF